MKSILYESYTKVNIWLTVPDTGNVCSKEHFTNSK